MVAHIEREDQIERNRTEADEINLLGHAVVQYLEIGRPEPTHRLPLVGDQDVYSDGLDLRREHGLLRAPGLEMGLQQALRELVTVLNLAVVPQRQIAVDEGELERVGDGFAAGVLCDEEELPGRPVQPQLNHKARIVAPFGDDVLVRSDEGDIRELAGNIVGFDGFLKGHRQPAPEVVDVPVEHRADESGMIAIAIERGSTRSSGLTRPRQISHYASR
jgi:hypothetical protein